MIEWVRINYKETKQTEPNDGELILVCYENGYINVERYCADTKFDNAFYGYPDNHEDPISKDSEDEIDYFPCFWARIETPVITGELFCSEDMD